MSEFSEKTVSVLYWSHKAFCAGNTVTALLQCSNMGKTATVSAQAYGHIFADKRWNKSAPADEIFLPMANSAINHSVVIPPALLKPTESVCIFTTPIEQLNFPALAAEGVVLQFDIPVEALPSFRDGVMNVHQTHFPFIVYGRGSSSTPQHLGYSGLVTYPLTSIPSESLLSQPAVEDDFYENQRRISAYNSVDAAVYAIRDVEFVCTVCVGLASATYCAGDMVTLCLDFEKNVQQCHAVRAKLMQCEKRLDGSRLQEKTLDSVFRNTSNAVSVYLLMHVPDIVECSFTCPYAEVSYRVEVDFFLQAGPHAAAVDAGSELPLAWSMGIDVLPMCYQSINPTIELIQCLEPGAIKVVKVAD